MSVQIYILVHEDIDGKMRTRRCCIADCFASERAKHALYASASQLSNNTYPEICLLSAWLYELNSAFSRLFLPYCLYQLVTQFCAVFFSPNFCLCYFTCFFPTMLGIFWEHAIEVNLSALIGIILPKQTQSCNMGEFKCSIIERTLKLGCVEKGSRSPMTRIWFVLKRKILTNTQEL